MRNVFLSILLVLLSGGFAASAQAPANMRLPPTTIDELNQFPFSGVLYGVIAKHLSSVSTSVEGTPAAVPDPAGSDRRGIRSSTERLKYRAVPDESVLSTTNISSDSNMDVEPAVIRQTNSSGSATIIVRTRYDASGLPQHYYYSNKTGGPYAGQLSRPMGYDWSGDPFLAESQLDTGQSPRRVYVTGVVGNNPGPTAMGVALWYSDNLGQSWTLSSNLVNTTSVSSTLLDKPTCDVSFYSGSSGYVFISYLRASTVNFVTTYEIHCARSTDGGASFDQDVVVYSSTTNILGEPSVVVGSGYIYVLWVDFSAGPPQKIYEARSPSTGTLAGTWSVDSGGPTGYFFKTSDRLNAKLLGTTVPLVRFNWSATKISVVWHEKESSTSALADVYYAAKGSGGWQSKVKISDEGTCMSHTDQFMPALDFDSSGNMIVTYYDRQNDCTNNSYYDEYFTKIDSTGSQLQAPTKVSTFQSDPVDNTFLSGTVNEYRFIGDYQQIWGDSGSPITWHSAWIGAPHGGSSDCDYTKIQ